MKRGGPNAALSLARPTSLRRVGTYGACPSPRAAETQAPQDNGGGRLFQVLAFKCLSVYQLTILPFNYLYSTVLATL